LALWGAEEEFSAGAAEIMLVIERAKHINEIFFIFFILYIFYEIVEFLFFYNGFF
jgi:hypothetical protein